MNTKSLYRAKDFVRFLDDDPNWECASSGHFELHSRYEIPKYGNAAQPVKGLDIERLVPGSGFHGMPKVWFNQLHAHAESISKQWSIQFPATDAARRRPVYVLFWDDRFELPVVELSASVSHNAKSQPARLRLGELSAQVANLQDEEGEDIPGEYIILVTMPLRRYWGSLRLEYLKGALTHEMAHVWTAWSSPVWTMQHFWGVIDEMTAVWCEMAWAKCRTAMDYAAIWTQQDSVSLYGVTVDHWQPRPALGYSQFPFLAWMNDQVVPRNDNVTVSPLDLVSAFWDSCGTAVSKDPWRHMHEWLMAKQDCEGGLLKLYGRYCGEAFTCAFRQKYLTGDEDAEWYLKCVQEVHHLSPEMPTLPKQKLMPLAKRAYLLRMDGESAYEVVLTSRRAEFVMHVIKDDGNGKRGPSKVVETDDNPPFRVCIPAAKCAVLVVACTALASPEEIRDYRVSSIDFTLEFKRCDIAVTD